MFSFIPLDLYTLVFFYATFFLVIISWIKLNNSSSIPVSSSVQLMVVFGLVFYMGLRPISGVYFGDMATYASYFKAYAKGAALNTHRTDIVFEKTMQYCSQIMSVEYFFLLISFLYVFLHYLAAKRLFKDYWYYSFLMLIASLSFWSYGTNGIRNGLAVAILMLAFSYNTKIIVAGVLSYIAFSIHKSVALPILVFALTFLNNNPKHYLAVWILCIPLSFLLGGTFETFIESTKIFDDDRMKYLSMDEEYVKEFSRVGFRWDFLLYSSTAVITGWYYIIKKQYTDIMYNRLYNVYVLANAFWIMIIRANFSNRFAYLSWFMMSIVIVYPLLKVEMFKNQAKIVGLVILIYYLFTFVLNVLLAK